MEETFRSLKKSTTTANTIKESGQICKRTYHGIYKSKSGRYAARIWDPLSKKRHWLGTFDIAEEAAWAYNMATSAMGDLKPSANFVYTTPVDDHYNNMMYKPSEPSTGAYNVAS
ncbi:ethylene-responsive transcription factor ESR2-like [Tripterygium wilfordii]|uniref:ethylene-responsive transcription factor ESR2-like n=1 Tax=Tripterygium wilfordii TaxID=458696 RepID=UPI0018F8448A|nr:ethylene-responsive transcription factor ESR2-like [Tripterygium wilfordii]